MLRLLVPKRAGVRKLLTSWHLLLIMPALDVIGRERGREREKKGLGGDGVPTAIVAGDMRSCAMSSHMSCAMSWAIKVLIQGTPFGVISKEIIISDYYLDSRSKVCKHLMSNKIGELNVIIMVCEGVGLATQSRLEMPSSVVFGAVMHM